MVNAMATKDDKGGVINKDGTVSKKKGESMFDASILTYLMFPASLGVVYYYQVYIKGNQLFGSSSGPTEQ